MHCRKIYQPQAVIVVHAAVATTSATAVLLESMRLELSFIESVSVFILAPALPEFSGIIEVSALMESGLTLVTPLVVIASDSVAVNAVLSAILVTTVSDISRIAASSSTTIS